MIAHLLGDFILQSNKLLKKKYKSWVGTLEHAIIIGLSSAIMIAPFLHNKEAQLIVILIFAIHFIQDVLKVEYDLRYNKKKRSPVPFFLDQAGHMLLILVLGISFSHIEAVQMAPILEEIYFSEMIAILLVSVILLTYTLDITVFQFKKRDDKKALIYHPDYQGMMQRLSAFAIFFLFYFVLYEFILFSA
jgi:hypothetical protein